MQCHPTSGTGSTIADPGTTRPRRWRGPPPPRRTRVSDRTRRRRSRVDPTPTAGRHSPRAWPRAPLRERRSPPVPRRPRRPDRTHHPSPTRVEVVHPHQNPGQEMGPMTRVQGPVPLVRPVQSAEPTPQLRPALPARQVGRAGLAPLAGPERQAGPTRRVGQVEPERPSGGHHVHPRRPRSSGPVVHACAGCPRAGPDPHR